MTTTTTTTTIITAATITHSQIRTLQAESSAAGDTGMVGICATALSGHARSRAACAKAINDAAAMADHDDADADADASN